MNNYCRTDNSQECLAEAAEKALLKRFCRDKIRKNVRTTITVPEFNQQFFSANKRGEFPISTAKTKRDFPLVSKIQHLRHPLLISTTSNINKEEALNFSKIGLIIRKGNRQFLISAIPKLRLPVSFKDINSRRFLLLIIIPIPNKQLVLNLSPALSFWTISLSFIWPKQLP